MIYALHGGYTVTSRSRVFQRPKRFVQDRNELQDGQRVNRNNNHVDRILLDINGVIMIEWISREQTFDQFYHLQVLAIPGERMREKRPELCTLQ